MVVEDSVVLVVFAAEQHAVVIFVVASLSWSMLSLRLSPWLWVQFHLPSFLKVVVNFVVTILVVIANVIASVVVEKTKSVFLCCDNNYETDPCVQLSPTALHRHVNEKKTMGNE